MSCSKPERLDQLAVPPIFADRSFGMMRVVACSLLVVLSWCPRAEALLHSPLSLSGQSRSHYATSNYAKCANTAAVPPSSLLFSASVDDGLEHSNALHRLWRLLHQIPQNRVTPKDQTREILDQIRALERTCPTQDEQVISKLSGNWELLWTARDNTRQKKRRNRVPWLNNLEKQSYTDGSLGRSNPILPQAIQSRLEDTGFLVDRNTTMFHPISTQTIDLKKSIATNAVSFQTNQKPSLKGFLAIQIALSTPKQDARRVNVNFRKCRVSVPSMNLDFSIPLWPFRLRGWLRTTYVDDTFRISRGHKGSVFVLARPNAQAPRKNAEGETCNWETDDDCYY
mmetsp:Transcript_22517/g.62525  ORF Transcript_22517/g.62525 Transcript_22517/m.62525 type:complete len:340 (+) Transcript_22517:46-1065(+)